MLVLGDRRRPRGGSRSARGRRRPASPCRTTGRARSSDGCQGFGWMRATSRRLASTGVSGRSWKRDPVGSVWARRGRAAAACVPGCGARPAPRPAGSSGSGSFAGGIGRFGRHGFGFSRLGGRMQARPTGVRHDPPAEDRLRAVVHRRRRRVGLDRDPRPADRPEQDRLSDLDDLGGEVVGLDRVDLDGAELLAAAPGR